MGHNNTYNNETVNVMHSMPLSF